MTDESDLLNDLDQLRSRYDVLRELGQDGGCIVHGVRSPATGRHFAVKVMDAAAISLARENGVPVIVFSIHNPGAFADVNVFDLDGLGLPQPEFVHDPGQRRAQLIALDAAHARKFDATGYREMQTLLAERPVRPQG